MLRRIILSFVLLFFVRSGFAFGTQYRESDLFATMRPGDRAALLLVHFGTTHDDTRALTIDALNRKARETFPSLDVFEAYTSRIVIRRLKQRGIERETPAEALERLRREGYTHIVIQSSNIIDGIEMESLRREAEQAASGFATVRIGNPLLYAPEDYARTIEALRASFPAAGAVVLVGHGTYMPDTAAYAMLDYMLKAEGFGRVHVGTIEGYPAFDDVVRMLESGGERRVTLIPLMFVAGEHVRKDIAGDWKEALERAGYEVGLLAAGLGENPAILDLFVDRIRFALSHERVPIAEKKKAYAAGRDKY